MPTDRNERKISQAYHGGDALDQAAERMMEREVLACQSSLVDAILSRSSTWPTSEGDPILSWDDVANAHVYRCPECLGGLKDYDGDEGHEKACTDCGWAGDETDGDLEPVDVMEWWLVSRWLADQLSARGEVVASDGQSQWWGRCCTGQGIILDGIMQRIVSETLWEGKLTAPRAEG